AANAGGAGGDQNALGHEVSFDTDVTTPRRMPRRAGQCRCAHLGSGIRLGISRRMSVRDFHLVTEWTLAAPIEAVWQTIAAPEAWPSWWRAVRKVDGTGLWTFTPSGDGTHLRYDWRVAVTKPWMRVAAPLLRPVFAWNH